MPSQRSLSVLPIPFHPIFMQFLSLHCTFFNLPPTTCMGYAERTTDRWRHIGRLLNLFPRGVYFILIIFRKGIFLQVTKFIYISNWKKFTYKLSQDTCSFVFTHFFKRQVNFRKQSFIYNNCLKRQIFYTKNYLETNFLYEKLSEGTNFLFDKWSQETHFQYEKLSQETHCLKRQIFDAKNCLKSQISKFSYRSLMWQIVYI